MPKAKAKKEKAEPTLSEQVAAIDDLDELKAFCKENKKAFPGVKAKKFEKVKKLRKAMLEVVVEPERERIGIPGRLVYKRARRVDLRISAATEGDVAPGRAGMAQLQR